MSIENFPASLQPMVQTGYLEHAFQDYVEATLVYDSIADRMVFAGKVGDTIIRTRPGLKAPLNAPLNPATNTGLDNGITPSAWGLEQFSVTLNSYGDGMDLNTVTEGVGIVSQFAHNVQVNAIQSAQTLDRAARNTLFNAYMAGNTFNPTAVSSSTTSLHVDDVRGFQMVPLASNNTMTQVSGATPLGVTLNGVANTVIGVSVDGTNTSTTALTGGISGTLILGTAISSLAQYSPVLAVNASAIIRPNGRATSQALVAGDLLTMSNLLDAVAVLRNNSIQPIEGAYNCYLDATSSRQLFADPDFRQLFQGATNSSAVFRKGVVSEMLGLRFHPTTEAFVQPFGSIGNIRRPIILGQGALIRGDYENMIDHDTKSNSIKSFHDGIVQVTRPPLDRFDQIISQAWYSILGYCVGSDITANTVVATANGAVYKRGVVIEHIG